MTSGGFDSLSVGQFLVVGYLILGFIVVAFIGARGRKRIPPANSTRDTLWALTATLILHPATFLLLVIFWWSYTLGTISNER